MGERSYWAAERQGFFDLSVDMMSVSNAKGYFVELNHSFETTLGWTKQELMSHPYLDFVHPDDRERTIKVAASLAKDEALTRFENRYRCKDGSYKWIAWSSYFDPEKALNYAVARDITPQKEREGELRFQSMVLDRIVTAVIEVDDKMKVLYWNKAAEGIFGWKAEEMIGQDLVATVRPKLPPGKEQEIMASLERDGAWEGHLDLVDREGRALIAYLELSVLPADFGRMGRYVGLVRDVTEQVRISDQIWNSEKRYRELFDNAGDIIFVYDPDGRIKQANAVARQVLKYELSQMIGAKITDMESQDEAATIMDHLKRALETGHDVIETIAVASDGTKVPLEVNSRRLDSEGGSVILSVARDITERKRTDILLRQEKERLDVTLRSIGDGVIVSDVSGNVQMLNRVAEDLTGWKSSEAVGCQVRDVFHIIDELTRERSEDPVETVLRTKKVCELSNHTILVARDGTERVLGDSGAPIMDEHGNVFGVVLVFRDVTEERRTQSELERMERLESVGVLAGGIAHDFNNLFTVVEGNLMLARMKRGDEKAVEQKLADAEKAMERARGLTKQLLAFATGGEPIKEVFEPEDVLREASALALSGSNVKFEFEIEPELWRVEGDAGQIAQVVNVVVMNAREAMPDGGIGHIIARNRVLKRGELSPLKQGHYIQIIVQDSGIGIPRNVLPRVFDPFFTTKQSGRGLGLAAAHAIVTRHDGHISISSVPGKGTEVTIHLPATDKPARTSSVPNIAVSGSKQRVLWMDDEELILELGKEMLDSLGYRPEVAHDGKEAAKEYRRAQDRGEPYDAVILDLVVPGGLGGMETIRALRSIDPGVKAIVCSGYSNDPVMSHYMEHGFSGVLPKPFGVKELSEALAMLLAEQEATARKSAG